MGLKLYSEKRDFKNTPEPKAKAVKAGKTLEFVIQRHDASHLHYDFRLEMGGVLKSWAVPKGPSLNPKHKRLAMMVEDHPYEYREFEGTIPAGNYGAGTVEIWDRGTYSALAPSNDGDEKELLKELKSGNLKFVLNGEKLKGEFALVKLKTESKQQNEWLLIKHRDQYAVDEEYNSEAYPSLTALKSSKVKAKVNNKESKDYSPQKKTPVLNTKRISRFAKKVHLENYVKPMLAKETDEPFDNPDWIFEIKWDGYRSIAETGKDLKFYSRNGISFLDQYPEIAVELKKIKTSLILDGEVTALDNHGTPNFQLLQNFDPSKATLVYYVFDILKKAEKDLTMLPLIERKPILQKALKTNEVIRYSDHIEGEGKKFFALVRERNMEGIIAKNSQSEYIAGARTSNWLKIKNHKGQEAVIVGFTEPRKSRKYFGSLVMGVYERDSLKYCGHTGTGFNDKTLKLLYEQLSALKTEVSPFKEKIKTNMPVTWVKPKLVCNVKFSEMTNEGIMRHPVFMGLREDKPAKEVVNEKKKKVKQPASN